MTTVHSFGESGVVKDVISATSDRTILAVVFLLFASIHSSYANEAFAD